MTAGLYYIIYLYNFSSESQTPALGGTTTGLTDGTTPTAFDFTNNAKWTGVGTTSGKTTLPTTISTLEINGGNGYSMWFGLY